MKKEKLFDQDVIDKYKKIISEGQNDYITIDWRLVEGQQNYTFRKFEQLEHNFFDFFNEDEVSEISTFHKDNEDEVSEISTFHNSDGGIDTSHIIQRNSIKMSVRRLTGFEFILIFYLHYPIFKIQPLEKKIIFEVNISERETRSSDNTHIYFKNIEILYFRNKNSYKDAQFSYFNFEFENVSFFNVDIMEKNNSISANWGEFFKKESFLSFKGDIVFNSNNPSLDFKITRDLYNIARDKSDFELASNVYNNLLLKKYKQLETTNISDKFILWFSDFISKNRTNILRPIGLYIGVIFILLFVICIFFLEPDILILLVPGSLIFSFSHFEDLSIPFILFAILTQVCVTILIYEIIVMARKFVEKKK